MERTYRQVRKLGRGAFGEVVLARVVETGELVALKRVYVRAPEQGVPDNLVREMRCMQAVQHPNVVPLLDVRVEGSTLVLVQPYCVLDLSALIRAQRHLIPQRIVKGLFAQMAWGLAACHASGVMHRDLKPSNVLLSAEGVAMLADWGLGRPMAPDPGPGERPPQYTHTVATRWYRAPELLYGARQYGPAVDVWALGAVLAELISLSPLIPGENDIDQLGRTIGLLGSFERHWPEVAHLPDYGKVVFPDKEPTPLQQVLPMAPPAALDLLSLMLRANPEERPTASQLLQHPFLQGEPLPSPPHEVAAFMEATVAASRRLEALIKDVVAPVRPAPAPMTLGFGAW